MTVPPRLHTDRLLLRAFEPEDAERYGAILADCEVMRFMGAGRRHAVKRRISSAARRVTSLEARRDIQRLTEHWDKGFGEWAVERRSDGALLGRIGFKHHPDFIADRTRVEVGWLLARDAWGLGYATEGATRALDTGFGDLGLGRVISIANHANVRSMAVMERLGLTMQGRTIWRGQEVIWSAKDEPS